MKIIPYGDLTFPDVAALSRDIPVLIPIGQDSYDLERAAHALRSDSLVLLPAIPYGSVRRDGLGALAVGQALWRRVLQGVQRELKAQEFRRVWFLSDQAGPRGRGANAPRFLRGRLASHVNGARAWTWPTDLAGRVVVVSTGHTEQHGLHLPLDTDTRIVEAIAQGVGVAAPERALCLPAWPYGVSTHTRQYPGTLNLGGRTFEDFFLAVVGRLIGLGARAILFSNGHGGNHSFLVNVVKWAGERWPHAFVAMEFLHTTGPALEAFRDSARGGMGHGCELETSYLLHLRPHAVHMERARPEVDFISTPNYYMDWIEGGRLIANPPWSDDTQTGVYGDPTLASAEKGRRWLAAAVEEKLQSLAEIQEQVRRREERRRERS